MREYYPSFKETPYLENKVTMRAIQPLRHYQANPPFVCSELILQLQHSYFGSALVGQQQFKE